MDFNLTRSDIIGDRGFCAFSDYFAVNPDQVYFMLGEFAEATGEMLGQTKENCSKFVEGLELASAALAFTELFTDTIGFIEEARSCQQAVCQHGVFSDEAFEGYKEVVRTVGYVAIDMLGVAGFLLSMRIADLATKTFAMVLEGAFATSKIIDIYDNIVVISEGTTAKSSLAGHKVELIKHNYNMNLYSLGNNLISLVMVIVSIAGKMFCPIGTLVLGFAGLFTAMGEFYEKREMQCISVENGLAS